ncbi:MAG: hypothetical protein KAF91_29315 [Nostoc sp. TH1S01]|nr:hypothetical protein [Nostoc sp. TH1S01]
MTLYLDESDTFGGLSRKATRCANANAQNHHKRSLHKQITNLSGVAIY